MARRITLCIVTLTSLLSFAQGSAPKTTPGAESTQDAETKLILESLNKRYQALGSWEAAFIQTEKSPGLSGETAAEGYFKFVKPNKFLLQINGSIKKTFVSNGTQAWFIEDNPQAKERYSVRKFKDAKALELERFLVFFQGLKSRNSKDFIVSGKFNKPSLEVSLVPKKESDFSEIKIFFHNLEDYPNQLMFTDAVGGETSMKIREAKPIPKVDDEWFIPKIPKGAKVEG